MTTTFTLQPGELDETFLKGIVSMFRDRTVQVVIDDLAVESNYPFDNPAQVNHIREALEQSKDRSTLVFVDDLNKPIE